jgi:arylsulfatase A
MLRISINCSSIYVMRNISFLTRSAFALVLAIGLLRGVADAKSAKDHPNIILIFVDDMGYGDLACYGNPKNRTPNIDRLAAEGQRWTSFYASGAVCVPSRRGLMSGRHPAFLNGVRFVDIRDQLLPAMLKEQGYATAILGKWHLAGYPEDFTKSPMHPLECGFDYHYGTPGSNDVPAPVGKKQTRALFDVTEKFTFQVPLIRGREIVEFPADQELFTKRYTKEAVNWIAENKDKPFFLYMAHNMPHAPVFASKEFQGRSEGGRFGDVVEEIDWSVGQVMAALKEQDIEKETLMIFTSDNGPWTMFGPHGGTAAPLQGEKGTSWEGGYRVPGIFRWPGKIKPGVVDDMGANLDLYATFAALTGGGEPNAESGYISKDLTGTLLRGETGPRKSWLYSSGAIAYRSGNYKIHLSTKNRSSNPDTREREQVVKYEQPLLFDLSQDLGERNNISAEHPELVSRLLGELNAYQKRSGAD